MSGAIYTHFFFILTQNLAITMSTTKISLTFHCDKLYFCYITHQYIKAENTWINYLSNDLNNNTFFILKWILLSFYLEIPACMLLCMYLAKLFHFLGYCNSCIDLYDKFKVATTDTSSNMEKVTLYILHSLIFKSIYINVLTSIVCFFEKNTKRYNKNIIIFSLPNWHCFTWIVVILIIVMF